MKNASYCYEYPRPMLTVDVLIFNEVGSHLLLIERGKDPFKGSWAIPGGFLDMGETTEEAAVREVQEETGLLTNDLQLINVFSSVNRDPRGRTITVAYSTQVNREQVQPKAGDDAANVSWFPIHDLPQLAFDHLEIIHVAIHKLKVNP